MGCGCKGKKNSNRMMSGTSSLFLSVIWRGAEQHFIGAKTRKDYGTLREGQEFEVIRFDYNDELMQLPEATGG